MIDFKPEAAAADGADGADAKNVTDSGAGAGDDSLPAGDLAGEGTSETDGADNVVSRNDAGERPDWLEDRYKTVDDQAKAYADLRSAFDQKKEKIVEEVGEELKADIIKELGIPEDVSEYALPDGIEISDETLAEEFRKTALEAGVNKDGFAKLAELYAKANAVDHEAELAALGEKAEERISRMNVRGAKMIPEELHQVAARVMERAEGFMLVEALLDAREGAPKGLSPRAPGITSAPVPTTNDIVRMKQDPRYHDPVQRDPAYVQKVNETVARVAKANAARPR